MKDLRHLSEITTRYGNRNINELEFATPEDFKKYKAKHKMRPGTVVKVAGKDKKIGDDKPKVGTKVKDGKIKSSGPQQFADDVKNMKGEFDLGGAKIKDGKMFDADGNQMDSDEIEDFYFQVQPDF